MCIRDRSVYNTEMQDERKNDLAKRSRYYQALIDTSLLEPGVPNYNALNTSYIIVIMLSLIHIYVVCEKPLTMTSEEAKELVHLAEEKNLVNAIHFNIRYYPLIRHAKEMIERGEIGKLYSITGAYLQDWLDVYKRQLLSSGKRCL